MKILKLITTIFVISFLTLLTSCSKDEPEGEQQDVHQIDFNQKRKQFIQNKNRQQIRKAYLELPGDEQVKLWIGKLQQIETTTIPQDQKRIITQLRIEFSSSRSEDKIKNLSIQLANKISFEAFASMFASLDDYKHDSKSVGSKMTSDLIAEINSTRINFESTSPNVGAKGGDCTCKWTCGLNPVKTGRTSCDVTETGCGWLWRQPCTGKDCALCVEPTIAPGPLPEAPEDYN